MQIRIIKRGTAMPLPQPQPKPGNASASGKEAIKGLDTSAIRNSWLNELNEKKQAEAESFTKIFGTPEQGARER